MTRTARTNAVASVRSPRRSFCLAAEALEARTLLSVAPAADNLPPESSGIPDLTVNEDAPNTDINLFDYFSDDSDPDTALGLAIQSVTTPSPFRFVALETATGRLTLSFVPNASGTSDVTIRATDTQGAVTTDTFTVTVVAVNDAPVNRIPKPQLILGNSPLVFGGQRDAFISTTDVDAGTASNVTMTLRIDAADPAGASAGTLTMASPTGLTFLQGDGTDDVLMSFSGTIAQINRALSSLRYDPAPGFIGEAALTVTTDDQGNTGAGGAQSDTDVLPIQVVPPATVSVSDAQVVEGDDGTKTVTVTIALSGPQPLTSSVRWNTVDGTGEGAAAVSDLVVDGGFESPPIGGSWAVFVGGQLIGPWTVEADSVDVVTMWQDAEGGQSVDLSGANMGGIYQDLATVPGQSYVLKFALSGNPENRGADPVKQVAVEFGDAAVDTLSFDVTGHSLEDMGWQYHTYTLTATSAVTRLRFRSLTVGDTGPAIDDVQVTPVGKTGDYRSGSGTVSFPPGITSRTVTIAVIGDTTVESDETFFVDLSQPVGTTIGTGRGTVTILNDDEAPAAPPRVAGVFVGDPRWPQAIRDYLAASGLGSAGFGYGVPGGAGDGRRMSQLAALPWAGANRVSVRFDSDAIVEADDLKLSGADGHEYALDDFAYDSDSHTASWSVSPGFSDDRIRLELKSGEDGVRAAGKGHAALDGEWNNDPAAEPAQAYPSGDGSAGGDFDFRFNRLAGDVNGDGSVNALDLADVRRRLNAAAGDGVLSESLYSLFADVAADGRINALDLAAVRRRLNARLPAAPVAALPISPSLAPLSVGGYARRESLSPGDASILS